MCVVQVLNVSLVRFFFFTYSIDCAIIKNNCAIYFCINQVPFLSMSNGTSKVNALLNT